MSRFARAYRAALNTADLEQAAAAEMAGYHTSMVSRLLKGRSALTTEHVKNLLLAIQNKSDREHCLREFLFDCCPEDYRAQLIITLGRAEEPRSKGEDDITTALASLERLAVDNDDLADLLTLLVSILTQNAGQAKPGDEKRTLTGLLNSASGKPTAIPRARK
jgi:hypothetical protein